jgi:hypothetical protein
MENKSMPILVICKVLLIFLSIFIGIILNGYPFGIVWFCVALPLQIFSIKMASQIEYLIPISDSDAKRFFLTKNSWIAGIYTTANTVGYILLVSFSEQYQWDKEMIFFILVMTIFLFNLFFYYRTVVVGRIYFEWKDRANFSMPKKENWWIVLEGTLPFLGLVWIYVFLLYEFKTFEFLSFLGRGNWRMVSIAVLVITILLSSYTTWRRCNNLMIKDYFG